MSKKYIIARLNEKHVEESKPVFLAYTENKKGIEEVVMSLTPGLLACDFIFTGLKEENPRDYNGNFSLAYEPTIDIYTSPKNVGDRPNHFPSKVYSVNKMDSNEIKEFEEQLCYRLHLNKS